MIELEMCAGEAHWQAGPTEEVILDLDGTMRKLQDARPDLSESELLFRSTAAHNDLERHIGFSPNQWAYGRGKSWDNTLHESEFEYPQGLTSEARLLEGLSRQQEAETAYLKWKSIAQIQRAERARNRVLQKFNPGDPVMVWRRGKGTTRREGQGSGEGPWSGQWRGVGRVLAQQTKVGVNGSRTPKSIVWVVIAGRLLRCAPEHLRPASRRERLLQEVVEPDETPWTFNATIESINPGEYLDLLSQPRPQVGESGPSVVSVSENRKRWSSEPDDDESDHDPEILPEAVPRVRYYDADGKRPRLSGKTDPSGLVKQSERRVTFETEVSEELCLSKCPKVSRKLRSPEVVQKLRERALNETVPGPHLRS